MKYLFTICEVLVLGILGFWQLKAKELLELEANIRLGKVTNMFLSLFISALGGAETFISLSLPSAFLADSSVTYSKISRDRTCELQCGHLVYPSRHPDWHLLGDSRAQSITCTADMVGAPGSYSGQITPKSMYVAVISFFFS